MKVIDKLISFVFDVAIIVVAIAILAVKFDVISMGVVMKLLPDYVFNPQYDATVISTCIVVILLALKTTVFTSSFSKKPRKNILVDTEHGKIQIAQNTIENIAKNVIKDYPQVKDVQAVMTKAKKGINMYMSLVAYQGINIRDIVTRVQADVKNQIEAAIGIKVYKVDVKVRNVIKTDATYQPVKPVVEQVITSVPTVSTENAKVEEAPATKQSGENEQNQ